jgi:hypothetical protein
MSALWASMIVAPLFLIWDYQAAFALDFLGIPAPRNQIFPGVVELVAWVCAFEAHRRGVHGRVFARWMWFFSLAAAGINFAHAPTLLAGLCMAFLSVVPVRLHSLRTGLDTGTGNGRAFLALWRRIRYPRLSLAAFNVQAATGTDAATAWATVWADRFGVVPEATKRERILGKIITARELGIDKAAAADGGLTITNGHVQHGLAPEVAEFLASQWAEVAAAVDNAAAETAARVAATQADAAQRIAAAEAAAAERIARAEAEAAARVDVADAARQAAEDTARRITDDAQAAVDATVALYGPVLAAPFGTAGNAEPELSPRATQVLPRLVEAIRRGEVDQDPSTRKVVAWWQANGDDKGLGSGTAAELCAEVKRQGVAPDAAPNPGLFTEGQAAEDTPVERAA